MASAMPHDGHHQGPEMVNGSNIQTQPAKSWTNPRKRPHLVDPTSLFELIGDDDYLRQTDNGKALHAPKRSRVTDWPLKNANETVGPKKGEQSPLHGEKGFSATSLRPSKFLEGSMNDKTSKKPPSIYTGEDEALERYANSQLRDKDEMDVTHDAGIESIKPSGMFRFGKTIASAFNPVHLWNGMWKEKDKDKAGQADPYTKVLQDRQAKAVEAYAELKKRGYKGTQGIPVHRESQDIPAIRCEDTEKPLLGSFRDSGIDIDESPSAEQNPSNQPTGPGGTLQAPASVGASGRSVSPFSDASSGRPASLSFRRASLQNLKKAKSHIRLPSGKQQTEIAPVPSNESDDASKTTLPGPGLRKEPSKRDIAKHYKLSKKVSDLENKLQIARRELEQSIATAPPVPEIPTHVGRKPFHHGFLASLPSERNMVRQGIDDKGAIDQQTEQAGEKPVVVGQVKMGTQNRSNAKGMVEPQLDIGRETDCMVPTSKFSTPNSKSNAHIGQNDKVVPVVPVVHESLDVEVVEGSTSKRKVGRLRKSQDLENISCHGCPPIDKRKARVPSKTPQNSPSRPTEDVPPLPANMRRFDPQMVDQAKIMSMRAVPGTKYPFGTKEDILNLRREFPEATAPQVIEYVQSQSAILKATDHTSVLHSDRIASPVLGRPVPASPMRTRSKRKKGGISAPPPSFASAKKVRAQASAKEMSMEGVESTSLAENKGQAKPPKVGKYLYYQDKPLPDIQKEEFDWPEDVF